MIIALIGIFCLIFFLKIESNKDIISNYPEIKFSDEKKTIEITGKIISLKEMNNKLYIELEYKDKINFEIDLNHNNKLNKTKNKIEKIKNIKDDLYLNEIIIVKGTIENINNRQYFSVYEIKKQDND
jgi:hypothetical protein